MLSTRSLKIKTPSSKGGAPSSSEKEGAASSRHSSPKKAEVHSSAMDEMKTGMDEYPGQNEHSQPSVKELVRGRLSQEHGGMSLVRANESKSRDQESDDGLRTWSEIYHAVLEYCGLDTSRPNLNFSLQGMEPAPPLATRRVVIVGTDDIAQQYLHRKLLRVPDDDFSGDDMSKVGVVPASKMSNSHEITMFEITEIPLKELIVELDSNNSYLLKETLPKADVAVFVFDAGDVMESLVDRGGGRAEYDAYCPSFIDLENLYDTMANMDLWPNLKLRVLVGNIGMDHTLKAGDVPHASINMAEEWVKGHQGDGLMRFSQLAIGSEKDVKKISRILEMDIEANT